MSFPRPSDRLLLGLRVVVLSLLILAVFWALVLLLASFTAWLRGAPLVGSGLLLPCTVCGLIAGLFIAVFHLKKETLRLPLANRQAFVQSVKSNLGDLGYRVVVEAENRLVFRPRFRSFLFGAGIRVELQGTAALVIGPKVYVELLRRRLRQQAFLDKGRLELGDRAAASGLPARSRLSCRNARLSSAEPAVPHGELLPVN